VVQRREAKVGKSAMVKRSHDSPEYSTNSGLQLGENIIKILCAVLPGLKKG